MLSRALGDVHRAEDAVQEAYVTALERWARDGVPTNPAAWIITTARNRAIDALRREARATEKVALYARLEQAVEAVPSFDPEDELAAIPDDRLGLIFACCHPSLNLEARLALTLRTVAGLTTEEIARAFLVPVATLAQRLVRAKQKIRNAGISFEIPDAAHLRGRLDAVCTTLYVMFGEGYATTSGDKRVRDDLCEEAIRLARLLVKMMPGQAEVYGLLALMLLQDARRPARVDDDGNIVTLEDQNRTLWNRYLIAEGLGVLQRASQFNDEGPYQLQAAIAAAHDVASKSEATHWAGIVQLYDRLFQFDPSPIVALNRAVAVAMNSSLEDGLAAVDALERGGQLDAYYLFYATRADLLRRMGRFGDAQRAYERALSLVSSEPERRFFERRIREMV